jgi:uncharacterized membrane protein
MDMNTDGQGTRSPKPTPTWLSETVHRIESDPRWDPVAAKLDASGQPLAQGEAGGLLRGEWLGHALHPLLTDVPLGCWQAAMFLDVLGGRRSRTASRRLIGIGVLAALPTAATGMVELAGVEDRSMRRVGAVHAVGNTIALGFYMSSWRARRRDRHFRGMALSLAGGSLAMFTGYLGGHLSFGRGVGVGDRGLDRSGPSSAVPSDDVATGDGYGAPGEVRGSATRGLLGVQEVADELTIAPAMVHNLVDQGLLEPAAQNPPRFRAEDVQAVRLQGG